VTADKRLDRRHFDLIIFANNCARQIVVKPAMASWTDVGTVIDRLVGALMQRTTMPLMPGLGTARPGMFLAGLLVARRRLGRCPRCLGRALQLQHKRHKFALAQLLKIIPIHTPTDSEKPYRVKGGE
jgi:uncharacterized membrane protein